MSEEKFMCKCDVCGQPYQHGPHHYQGHALALYGDIFACNSCWTGNHDGWAPHREEALIAHLQRQDIPVPERNEKGRLPRG